MAFLVTLAATAIGLPNLWALLADSFNWYLLRSGDRRRPALYGPFIVGALDALFLFFPPLVWVGVCGLILMAEHALVVTLLRRRGDQRAVGSDLDG